MIALAVLLFTTVHATIILTWQPPPTGCQFGCTYIVYRRGESPACKINELVSGLEATEYEDQVLIGERFEYAVSASNPKEGPCTPDLEVRVTQGGEYHEAIK